MIGATTISASGPQAHRRHRLRPAEMLAWLVHERDIHPHIPVFDKSARNDGTFARADFSYDLDAITTPAQLARC